MVLQTARFLIAALFSHDSYCYLRQKDTLSIWQFFFCLFSYFINDSTIQMFFFLHWLHPPSKRAQELERTIPSSAWASQLENVFGWFPFGNRDVFLTDKESSWPFAGKSEKAFSSREFSLACSGRQRLHWLGRTQQPLSKLRMFFSLILFLSLDSQIMLNIVIWWLLKLLIIQRDWWGFCTVSVPPSFTCSSSGNIDLSSIIKLQTVPQKEIFQTQTLLTSWKAQQAFPTGAQSSRGRWTVTSKKWFL